MPDTETIVTETPATVAPKTDKKKRKKTAPNSNHKPDNDFSKERASAKDKGLSLVHYRILSAIVRSAGGLTYRQIEQKTGYYSILTAQLRPDHEGSLGANQFVKEEQHDINNRDTLVFKATAKGRKLFGK